MLVGHKIRLHFYTIIFVIKDIQQLCIFILCITVMIQRFCPVSLLCYECVLKVKFSSLLL